MEVHHHTQTADPDIHRGRKKWTHYFWEFLMLFLAVFCGFLAENQREHYIELRREKQYMRSMMEDLMLDTAELNSKTSFLDSVLLPDLRASTELLYTGDFSDSMLKKMYIHVPRSSRSLDVSFEDRTMSQLKNAGNLRLIKKKEITDSLASYWKTCNYLNSILLPGYENTRLIVKEINYSLFDLSFYEGKTAFSPLRSNVSLKLLSDERKQFIKLGNFISNLHNQAAFIIQARFLEANRKATNLIKLIKEKYHLE